MITKSTPLSKVLELAKPCRKCGHCCRFGSAALSDEDLPRIAAFMGMTEDKLKEEYLEEFERFNTKRLRPKSIKKNERPYGRCIFLKGGRHCEIHMVKPLGCKVGKGCGQLGEQFSIWFALNHFVNANDPESVRQWAAYLKTQPTIEGGRLEELVPDEMKLKDIMGYGDLKKQ